MVGVVLDEVDWFGERVELGGDCEQLFGLHCVHQFGGVVVDRPVFECGFDPAVGDVRVWFVGEQQFVAVFVVLDGGWFERGC